MVNHLFSTARPDPSNGVIASTKDEPRSKARRTNQRQRRAVGAAKYGRRLVKRGALIDGIMRMPVAGRRILPYFHCISAGLGPFIYQLLSAFACCLEGDREQCLMRLFCFGRIFELLS